MLRQDLRIHLVLLANCLNLLLHMLVDLLVAFNFLELMYFLFHFRKLVDIMFLLLKLVPFLTMMVEMKTLQLTLEMRTTALVQQNNLMK